ncbi:MAG: hypothetical protein KDA91_25840, partial [Planctomycetaceae bacterium]|nr:hypothetical protein [Planctomycetaceae bacterium]
MDTSVRCEGTLAAIRCRRFATQYARPEPAPGTDRPMSVGAFCLATLCLCMSLPGVTANADDEPFRPTPGTFPPVEMAHSYRGELIFVDHANRRGSIRVVGSGMFFRNDPHPFAMLPYGIVRYHGAPADLRDIPLGTVMHVKA